MARLSTICMVTLVGCVAAMAASHTAAVPITLTRVQTPARNHDRDLQALEELPVFGQFRTLAYFYMDVFMGTPPQRFSVIADTGSSLLAVPCSSCSSCGAHMNPKFNFAASSTASYVGCNEGVRCVPCSGGNHCGYSQSYAEGSSLHGIYVKDKLWMGGESSSVAEGERYGVDFPFGCHTSEGGLFTSQRADGIMGLSRSSETIVHKLYASHKLEKNMFSMCLTLTGGVFNLGDDDASLHKAPMKFTGSQTLGSFWKVTLTSVQVEGSSTATSDASANSGQGTIVDSGTSFGYLPAKMYNAVVAQVTSFCRQSGKCKGTAKTVSRESVCYKLAHPSDIKTFPTMTWNLDHGVTLTMPPESLFIVMDWTHGAHCLAVYNNAGHSGAVIGANTMMYHDVVFDVANNRVGFAPSDCVMPADGNTGSGSGSDSGSGSGTTTPIVCHDSMPGCVECAADDVCTRCDSGYANTGSGCVRCGANEIVLGSGPHQTCGTCAQSIPHCDACTDANTCSSCAPGYANTGSACARCADGTYVHGSGASQTCATCSTTMPGCSRCSSASACEACDAGFANHGSSCLECTHGNLVVGAGSAQSCHTCGDIIPGCEECSASAECTRCSNGYALSAGSCQRCSSNQIAAPASTGGQQCKECSDMIAGCATCASASQCTTCNPGYANSGSACTKCAANAVVSGVGPSQACTACSTVLPGCDECSGSHTCTKCHAGDGTAGFALTDTHACAACQAGEESNGIVCSTADDPQSSSGSEASGSGDSGSDSSGSGDVSGSSDGEPVHHNGDVSNTESSSSDSGASSDASIGSSDTADPGSSSRKDFIAGIAAGLVGVVAIAVIFAMVAYARQRGIQCGPISIVARHRFARLPHAGDIEAPTSLPTYRDAEEDAAVGAQALPTYRDDDEDLGVSVPAADTSDLDAGSSCESTPGFELAPGAAMSYDQFAAFWDGLKNTEVFRASFPSDDDAADDLIGAFTYAGMQHVVPDDVDGVDASTICFAAEDSSHQRVLVQADCGEGEMSVVVKSSSAQHWLDACVDLLQQRVADAGGVVE